MKPCVVLSGFMATGKSTVGRALADRLGLAFVDTDHALEKATGMPVPDLWRERGEEAFRQLEQDLILPLLNDGQRRVIALGGGSVTRKAVRQAAYSHGFLVTLRATPEAIVHRVKDLGGRPNLAVGGDPLARARHLLEQRAEAYAEAHLQLSTEDVSLDDLLDAIEAGWRSDPVLVPLGGRSYTVRFGTNEPTLLTDAMAALAPSKVVVVSDSNVQRCRGSALAEALRPLTFETSRVTLAPGEEHKTLASVATIWDCALGDKVDRDSLVVAFGGGVVGDLAGFAASTLLRGLRFLQVPTTLLSMVDSSVGGKTGFDHATGKNLVGSFHQPSAVVVDLEHLETLPKRDRVAGLAEVVKVALVADGDLFGLLEESSEKLSLGDRAAELPIVRRAVEAKSRIVAEDETESGRRALLNLGHTLGHAIETHGGYSRWRHGEAVALGTVLELRWACEKGITPWPIFHRTVALFERLGLPTALPSQEVQGALVHLDADKKRRGSHVTLPVVRNSGTGDLVKVPLRALHEAASQQDSKLATGVR
jgi:shikimate kinase/3-dehydroquinate synthase